MSNVKISEGIFPIDQFGKMGKIHSVFDRSFNLKVGERLINVANYSGYLASFGLYLEDTLYQSLVPYLQQDNLVKVFSKGLTIYSREGIKKITWSDCEIVSLQAKNIQLTKEQQDVLKAVLEEAQVETKIGLPIDCHARQIFAKLRQKELTPSEWNEIISYLIGRGKGLTPSGDDILVAYLVMLYVRKDSRSIGLSHAFKQRLLSTTDISKEYIWYARQGYVNSLVYQLYIDLKNNKEKEVIAYDVQQVMRIGHSSGNDLCYGLLLAIDDEEKERIT
ncbi:DUF2877 domain-containing protein [Enterococcus saccharolyticus]|uniref:DUF2877 domain-containing protein n=1 Tax=Enterococcus saccharolyticus TaxID=41997 RepID=UPI0039E07726